jgi:hypothetical protein
MPSDVKHKGKQVAPLRLIYFIFKKIESYEPPLRNCSKIVDTLSFHFRNFLECFCMQEYLTQLEQKFK